MKPTKLLLATILTGMISISTAYADSALTLGQAAGFNVFVFSDFTEVNTDTEGAMAVGRDFNPNGGGFTVDSTGATVNGFGLVVGRNYTNSNTQGNKGNDYVGGNMTWTNPSLAGNAYVAGNFVNSSGGGSISSGYTIDYGGTYSSGSTLSNAKVAANSALLVDPINFATAQTSLQSLSGSLAGDNANGNVFHQYSTYTLTGTSSTLNVFNMTDTSYSGQTINISAPAGSTVIINVAGASDSFSSGSINFSGGITQNNVIFNFSQATSLSIGSMAFDGTILAPYASFVGNGGQLNGQLIALSASGTTEIHNALFTGNLGTANGTTNGSATPEPATWAMMGGVLMLLAAKRFRSLKLIPVKAEN